MKVSEITRKDVAEYLKLDDFDIDTELNILDPIMDAAKAFIINYTNLNTDEIDKYEDIWIAYMVLCQDMYDNRNYYIDKGNVNRVVETILSMHRRNLVL